MEKSQPQQIRAYSFKEAQKVAESMLRYIQNKRGHTQVRLYIVEGHMGATKWTLRYKLGTGKCELSYKDKNGKQKTKKFGNLSNAYDEINNIRTDFTLKYEIPKVIPYITQGKKWYDINHQVASDRKKRGKCKKFGNLAFPNNATKAKQLEDKLFKEW